MENKEKKYSRLTTKAEKMIFGKKLKKALPLIQEAIDLLPDKWEAYVYLGNYYGNQGDYESAIQWNKTALVKFPGAAIAHFNIAQCLIRMDNKKDGIANLKMCVNLDPTIKEAYRMLIYELINEGHQDAYAYLIEAIGHHPDDGVINFLLANKLITNRENLGVKLTTEVLKYLDKAENKGIDADAVNGLRGGYYYQQKDWDNAAKYYSRSLENRYDEDLALRYADCLHKLGYYDQSCTVISEMGKRGNQDAKQLIEKYPENFLAS